MFISPRLKEEARLKFFANLVSGLPVKFFEVFNNGTIQERNFIGMIFTGGRWEPIFDMTEDNQPITSSQPCFWPMTEVLCFLDKVEADQ